MIASVASHYDANVISKCFMKRIQYEYENFYVVKVQILLS